MTAARPLLLAILLYSAATFCSSVKDVSVKGLGDGFPVSQILFVRLLGDLLPVALALALRPERTHLRTRRWRLHAARALCMSATMILLYLSLRRLPLAEATALFMLGPVLMTLLSPVLLGDPFGWRHLAVAGIGLAGALAIVQPGLVQANPLQLLPLAAAFTYALVSLASRELGRTDSTVAITAYGSLAIALLLLAGTATTWTRPAALDLPPLAGLALAGGISSYLYVAACRKAPLPLIAPIDYLGLVWAAAWGLALWGERPGLAVWLGGALIVTAAVLASSQAAAATAGRG